MPKFSELPQAPSLDGSEIVAVTKGGVSQTTTTADIAAMAQGGIGAEYYITGFSIPANAPIALLNIPNLSQYGLRRLKLQYNLKYTAGGSNPYLLLQVNGDTGLNYESRCVFHGSATNTLSGNDDGMILSRHVGNTPVQVMGEFQVAVAPGFQRVGGGHAYTTLDLDASTNYVATSMGVWENSVDVVDSVQIAKSAGTFYGEVSVYGVLG